MEFITITNDGVDKVGKHNSVLASTKTLLESNHKVILMDLPQYWNVGGIVYKALRMKDLPVENGYRETEVRCVLYSLDRITSLIHVLPLMKLIPDGVLVSDRGNLSSVLTAGYARSQGKLEESEVEGLVRKFSYWDREYVKILHPTSILLTIGSNGKSAHDLGLQEREDVYEHPTAQSESTRIFKEYLKLPEVLTQSAPGEWRDRIDIAHDILRIAKASFNKNISQADLDKIKTEDILNNKNLTIIGPGLVYPIIYGKEWNIIKSEFTDLIDKWNYAIIEGNKTDLRIIEPKLIDLSLKYIPKDVYFETPENIKQWLQTTFQEFPEIKKIVVELCGEEYWKYLEKFAK